MRKKSLHVVCSGKPFIRCQVTSPTKQSLCKYWKQLSGTRICNFFIILVSNNTGRWETYDTTQLPTTSVLFLLLEPFIQYLLVNTKRGVRNICTFRRYFNGVWHQTGSEYNPFQGQSVQYIFLNFEQVVVFNFFRFVKKGFCYKLMMISLQCICIFQWYNVLLDSAISQWCNVRLDWGLPS